MKLTKKLYNELYDYYWTRAELKECKTLKDWYHSSENIGKVATKIEAIKHLKIRGKHV